MFKNIKESRGDYDAKIITYKDACKNIRSIREAGKRVILVTGVFEFVHQGHAEFLQLAKNAGDVLIIGIENDQFCQQNKPPFEVEGSQVRRPFNSQWERLKILSYFSYINYCFVFDEVPTPGFSEEIYLRRNRELQPTAIAVTSFDSNLEKKKEQAKECGIELIIVGCIETATDNLSSTLIIERLLEHQRR